MTAVEQSTPLVGSGVACIRDGKIALIRRAASPGVGDWSIPGGRPHRGETMARVARRELREETGLTAGPLTFLGVADVSSEGRSMVLFSFAGPWSCGVLSANDDAAEANWFSLEDAMTAVSLRETRHVITSAFTLLQTAP